MPVHWEPPVCMFACARTCNKYAQEHVDGGSGLYIKGTLMWSCSDTHHSTYRSLSIGSSHSSLSRRHSSGGRQLVLLTQWRAGARWEWPLQQGFCQSLEQTAVGYFCLFVCLSEVSWPHRSTSVQICCCEMRVVVFLILFFSPGCGRTKVSGMCFGT